MEFTGWDIASVLAKAITYAATFGAAGGVFFLAYSLDIVSDVSRGQIRGLIRILAIVGSVISAARIGLLAGSMDGAVAGMVDLSSVRMILSAGEGRATGIRIVGLILTSLAILPGRVSLVLAIVGAVTAATSFAWIGHAHAVNAGLFPIALLILHLLCVAFWIGALGPLLLVARDRDLSILAAMAARFGHLAMAFVALLVVAGGGLLWVLLHGDLRLWESLYGQALLIKLSLVACLLGLAALNKLRLTPRLTANDTQAAASLQRSIRAEMCFVGLIFALTATLTTTMGPGIG